jgi:hypothetical protein
MAKVSFVAAKKQQKLTERALQVQPICLMASGIMLWARITFLRLICLWLRRLPPLFGGNGGAIVGMALRFALRQFRRLAPMPSENGAHRQ